MSMETIFTYDRIIGYIGIAVSVWAAIQAKGANKAAREARRELQLRSTEEEITDICSKCDLKESVTWMEANKLVADLTGKTKAIIGQYKSNEKYAEAINDVESALTDLDIKFNSLSPEGETITANSSQICSTLAFSFRKLIGSLREFSGRLTDQVINK